MAGSSFINFAKAVLLPLIVATALYLFLFYAVVPFYRRYRANIARYSQYAPLTSTLQNTTSLFSPYIPEALRPTSLREKLGALLVKYVLPSKWAWRNREGSGTGTMGRRDSILSDEGDEGLFDEESGERMVGFDINQGRRDVYGHRRDERLCIRDSEDDAAIADSNRRLSRELEEGFRDDSAGEQSDEEVTVGRRRMSITR